MMHPLVDGCDEVGQRSSYAVNELVKHIQTPFQVHMTSSRAVRAEIDTLHDAGTRGETR